VKFVWVLVYPSRNNQCSLILYFNGGTLSVSIVFYILLIHKNYYIMQLTGRAGFEPAHGSFRLVWAATGVPRVCQFRHLPNCGGPDSPPDSPVIKVQHPAESAVIDRFRCHAATTFLLIEFQELSFSILVIHHRAKPSMPQFP